MSQHKVARVKAGGRMTPQGVWEWDKPIWTDCWCGMKHSNRVIPDRFFKQNWGKRTYRKEAGILLYKESPERSYLLVQNYGKHFGVPKGTIGENEPYLEGALREFEEETGTKLDISGNYTIFKHRYLLIFIIRVPDSFQINTLPLTDVEVTSYGFVKQSQLSSFIMNRASKYILEFANEINS